MNIDGIPLVRRQDVKSDPQLVKIIAYQMTCKIGIIPQEVKDWGLGKKKLKDLNAHKLLGQLKLLQNHAIYIKWKGWQEFIIKLDKKRTPPVVDEINQIQSKIEQYRAQATDLLGYINLLQWMRAKMIDLLLNPRNLSKEIKKLGPNLGVVIIEDKKLNKKIPEKDTFLKEIIHKIFTIFSVIEQGDEIFFNEIPKTINIMEQISSSLDQLSFSFLSYEEISDFLTIMRGCLQYPEELGPLLLIPLEVEPGNMYFFSPSLLNFSQNLYVAHNYACQALKEECHKEQISSPCEQQITEPLEKGNKQYQGYLKFIKEFNDQLFKNSLFGFLRCIPPKSFPLCENYSIFTLKNNKAFKKDIDKLECYFGVYFSHIHRDFSQLLQFFINRTQNYRKQLISTAENVKKLFPNYSEYSLGLFSIFDLLYIDFKQAHQQTFNAFEREVKQTKEGEDHPIITCLDNIEECFINISWSSAYLGFEDKELAPQVGLCIKENIKVINEKIAYLKDQFKNKKAPREFDFYTSRLVAYLEIMEDGAEGLFPLLTCPIIEKTEQFNLSTEEANHLRELIKNFKNKVNFYFDQNYITALRNALEKKSKGDHFHLFLSLYLHYLKEWKLRIDAISPQSSLIYQVSLTIELMNNYCDFINDHRLAAQQIYELDPICLEHIDFLKNQFNKSFIYPSRPLIHFQRLHRLELLKAPKKKRHRRSKASFPSKAPSNLKPLSFRPPVKHPIHQPIMRLDEWKEASSLTEQAAILHSLCLKAPLTLFKEERRDAFSGEEALKTSILDEATIHLERNCEELVILTSLLSKKLDPYLFLNAALKLAVSLEQTLKLLLTRSALSSAHSQAILSHQISLLYHQLNQPLLSSTQEECLRSLDSLIDVTSRYEGYWLDYPSLVFSQMHYLAQLQKLSSPLPKEAKEWIYEMLNDHPEESSLISEGWKYLQNTCNQFFMTGFDTLKTLLFSLDVETMAQPIARKEVDWIPSLEEALKLSHKIALQPLSFQACDLHRLLADIRMLDAMPSRTTSQQLVGLRRRFLAESQKALEAIEELLLIPCPSFYAHANTLLLKEAVFIEQSYYALMTLFEGQSICSEYRNKPFYYSHAIQKSAEFLSPHLNEVNPAILENLRQRGVVLEPILKHLYRYPSKETSKPQPYLKIFYDLDRLSHSYFCHNLSPALIESIEHCLEINEKNSTIPDELNKLGKTLLEGLVITPCLQSLQNMKVLFKIFHSELLQVRNTNN